MQNKGAILLERALRQNPDVKHVANIGARVDLVSAFLAPKFPQVQFTSVDLQLNVAEHNTALLQAPNWDFLGGYALHLMDEGKLKADLVFMTSTNVLFNNMELEAYLAAFAKQVKVVVLNEPWWPNLLSIGLTILRPEDVQVDNPVCSGAHGNYHHHTWPSLRNTATRSSLPRFCRRPKWGLSAFRWWGDASSLKSLHSKDWFLPDAAARPKKSNTQLYQSPGEVITARQKIAASLSLIDHDQ